MKALLRINLDQTENFLASKDAQAAHFSREKRIEDLIMKEIESKKGIITVKRMR